MDNEKEVDVRQLAEEAIRLAEAVESPEGELVERSLRPAHHSRKHYATLARALLAALDCAKESAEIMRRARDRADAATAERDEAYVNFEAACATAEGFKKSLLETGEQLDALLADLPHALGCCGCVPVPQLAYEVAERFWPEEHTAALKRLEKWIK